MAARGRPRAGAKDETATHEERDLWSKIVTDIKELTRQSKRVEDLAKNIQEEEDRLYEIGRCHCYRLDKQRGSAGMTGG